ncbi:MAG: family 43 glycosylhydrolase [Akkermansiaceae bacterium]|nr:family 43 glycosylhydrolase [Akkermansiaceae bacterium]
MIQALSISFLLSLTGLGSPLPAGADPHVIRVGETYWMYPTESGAPEPLFAAYRSTDLKDWKREAVILKLSDLPWVKEDPAPRRLAWAPSMLEKNGRYYFYYSVGPQSVHFPSHIGVATGDSPTGPFRDSGGALLTGGNGFEAIDPMAFTDPANGKTYLYTGGSDGARLRIFELEDEPVKIRREVPTTTPSHFTEGSFMHRRGDTYYLSYSNGRWNRDEYSVHYATAPSPVGPWNYRGMILSKDGERQGPGHHSFVESPDGQWFIVYHRWETKERPGPYRGRRQIAVEKIQYDEKGLILPVVMTPAAGN